MRDVIPDPIFSRIQNHIRSGCAHAEAGWVSGQEEEDTLTGDLGASLRKNWTRRTTSGGRQWRWRMTYSKFRGRGPNATESIIGADGIIQVEVEDVSNRTIETKGILFQAKKQGAKAIRDLPKQARKMESLVSRGSAIFEYGPQRYRAADASEIVNVENGDLFLVDDGRATTLANYLADRFLPCKTGLRGMYYEASRKTLFVPNSVKGFVRYRRQLRHRFRIEVQSRQVELLGNQASSHGQSSASEAGEGSE